MLRRGSFFCHIMTLYLPLNVLSYYQRHRDRRQGSRPKNPELLKGLISLTYANGARRARKNVFPETYLWNRSNSETKQRIMVKFARRITVIHKS